MLWNFDSNSTSYEEAKKVVHIKPKNEFKKKKTWEREIFEVDS
jgi:hypothetical protein